MCILYYNADGSRGGKVFTGSLSVCISTRYLKNWCSSDSQTWHRNVSPWVL